MATGLRLRRVAKRRQSILEYFVEVERLFGPSIREIQLHLEGNGFAEVSLGNLNADMCRLREDGYLIHLRDDAKAGQPEDAAKPKRQHRPYRLTEKGRAQARSGSPSDLMAKPIPAAGDGGRPDGRAAGAWTPSREPYDPPLVGAIAAGNPIDPAALAVDATTLLDVLACDPLNVVMKVRGTSMEGANIHDGDYVVVRAQPPEGVSKQDIVVVVQR
jgi:SOS-response transcriptional repressor LexA